MAQVAADTDSTWPLPAGLLSVAKYTDGTPPGGVAATGLAYRVVDVRCEQSVAPVEAFSL